MSTTQETNGDLPAPLGHMGFRDAVKVCLAKYVVFGGRASRAEYGYWLLFTVIAPLVLMLLGLATDTDLSALNDLFTLAILLPSIAVGTRRLHDIDRTGWWQLLWFVPIIGWVVLSVWACQRGTHGINRYG
jgi:uncharacterized membrane protein YhaH (DUF805 family)